MTIRVRKGIPSLRSELLAKRVTWALLAQRKNLAARGATHFQVVHFTIQKDHLHLIVEANDKRGLSRGVGGLEVRIARVINTVLGRKGCFWSERYHRRDLRTPTDTRNVLRYVLMNVQKHARRAARASIRARRRRRSTASRVRRNWTKIIVRRHASSLARGCYVPAGGAAAYSTPPTPCGQRLGRPLSR